MPQAQTAVEAIAQNREVSAKAEEESARHANGAGKPNDRYFIVKSLTVEDLELSVRTGIWATQSHNEEAFNKAYEVRPIPTDRLIEGADGTCRPSTTCT